MNGLFLKDFYMIKNSCRLYLIIALSVFFLSFVFKNDLFFILLPYLLCAYIPIYLIIQDEHSRWFQYSCTLPYTKAQIVSSKYLLSISFQTALFLITGIVRILQGIFMIRDYIVLLIVLLIINAIISVTCLPITFKYGIAKSGNLIFVVFSIMFGMTVPLSEPVLSNFNVDLTGCFELNIWILIIGGCGLAVYFLSWYMSIILFKNREFAN